jgi:hypothetical protein
MAFAKEISSLLKRTIDRNEMEQFTEQLVEKAI